VVQDRGELASDRRWWKRVAGDQAVYRLITPVIFWWGWAVFAVVFAAQSLISDHDYLSVELTAGLAIVTAVVYGTALRPKVIADDDGVSVRNPFRDHRIGWGGLNAVHQGDSVELSCARPAPGEAKTIYCWAVYSGRRSRARAELRADRSRTRGLGGGYGTSSRAPAEVQARAKQDAVQVVAAEIGRRSEDAQRRGAPAAVLTSTWAWWPLAFVMVPAVVLLGLILAR
jgi:Bacterial PH domain